MAKIKKEISRRNLFRHLGNAAVAAPFMRTLLETQAFGETVRKNAVFFYYPNGHIRGSFHPDAVGRDFKLKASTLGLEPVRDDIIIPLNLNYNISGSHEHGMQYCLTGIGGMRTGISIDTELGNRMKEGTTISTLRLGAAAMTRGDDFLRPCSFNSEKNPAQIQDNPLKSFESLFGTAPGTGAPAASSSGLSVASRKSVLDSNLKEIARLQAALGAIEKIKLEQHVNSIREIERRLQTMASGGMSSNQCSKTLKKTRTFNKDEWLGYAAYDDVVNMNIEIAIMALACGSTNVVLIQNTHSVGQTKHDANGFPTGDSAMKDAHDDSHDRPDKHKLNINYYMGRFASLISGLKSTQEGDKTLLSNSAVMCFSEFADCQAHDMNRVGVVLAGEAGGKWTPGRVIDVKSASHNQLLVSMMQAMDFDDNSFGDPNLGKGPLPGLKA